MVLTEEIIVNSGVRDKGVVDEMTFFHFPVIFRHFALHHPGPLDILKDSNLLVFGKTKEYSHAVRKEYGLGHIRVVDRWFGFLFSLLSLGQVGGSGGPWWSVGIIVIFAGLVNLG